MLTSQPWITTTVQETFGLALITNIAPQFVDVDVGDALTYSLSSNTSLLPIWLSASLTAATLSLSAVYVPPGTAGSYAVLVTATDASGTSATTNVTVFVQSSSNGTIVAYGPWSVCSALCETGIQYRTVQCTTATSRLLPYTSCPRYNDVVQSKVCNTFICPSPIYKVEEWNTCTERCFGGVKGKEPFVLRPVTCLLDNSIVGWNVCDDSDLPRPRRIRNCNLPLCDGGVHWQPQRWSACDTVCGYGSKHRTVTCVDANGTAVDPQRCPSDVVPTTVTNCVGTNCGCTPTTNIAGAQDSCTSASYCNATTLTCTCLEGYAGLDCSFASGHSNVNGCKGTFDRTGVCCPYDRQIDDTGLCCGVGNVLDGNGACCNGIGTFVASGRGSGGGDGDGSPSSVHLWETDSVAPSSWRASTAYSSCVRPFLLSLCDWCVDVMAALAAVDKCGVCNGPAVAVDINGVCCSTALAANHVCCQLPNEGLDFCRLFDHVCVCSTGRVR